MSVNGVTCVLLRPFHGIRFVVDRTFRDFFLSQKLFLGIFYKFECMKVKYFGTTSYDNKIKSLEFQFWREKCEIKCVADRTESEVSFIVC